MRSMGMRSAYVLLLLALLALRGTAAAAEEAVDMRLMLVVDVSRSIDDEEYALEKQGYASALSSSTVIAAIQAGAIGAITVSYIEFAGPGQVAQIGDETIIRD